jgi:hypothetical protein
VVLAALDRERMLSVEPQSVGLRDRRLHMALREFQFNLTVDEGSGGIRTYLLELEEPRHPHNSAQWQWIADHEFGPFDTSLDVSTWLCRELVKRKALPAR